MNDEVLEMMTQLMTDVRLEDIVRENQEYQQALKEERAIYEKFRKLLNQEQKDLLEEFLAASSESACVYDSNTPQSACPKIMGPQEPI